MGNKEIRDVHYWASRLRDDKNKLDESSKLSIIRSFLIYTTQLEPEEVDLFLAPKETLSNPERLMQYAIVERKVAEVFSLSAPENWDRKARYLSEVRNALKGVYTSSEFDEIETHIPCISSAGCLTVWLAGDHYAFRRIRNAYLPEITDLIGIDTETGMGQNLTDSLFAEGLEDAASKIKKVVCGE